MNIKAYKIFRVFSHLMRKICRVFNNTSRLIVKPNMNKNPAYEKWFGDNGDKSHRLYYSDLHKNSLVFDIGGYEGQWASDIYSMYRCRIYVFEPVEEFANGIRRRFVKNPDICVNQFGISDRNWTTKIALNKDGTSVFKPSNKLVDVQFVEATKYFRDNDIQFIDLMKINIEGGEYDLLDYLINNDWATKINNIQVQFHNFVPDAEKRMTEIQKQLIVTHELTYQYKFVWENWKLKKQL